MFLTICFKNNFENKSAIFFHPLGKGPVPVQLGKIASKKIKGEFSLIYANATYFAFIRVLKSKQQDFSTYCSLYQCPTFSHFHAFQFVKMYDTTLSKPQVPPNYDFLYFRFKQK